jgi:osmotically-inducible protein OsmY
MGIRDFVKNVGEKILPDKGNKSSGSGTSGGRQQQQYSGTPAGQQGSGSAQSTSRPPQTGQGAVQSQSDERAQEAILQHIKDNVAEAPEDLVVVFEADDRVVILTGTAPNDEVAELIIVTAGNIEGVCQVDDRMTRGEKGTGASRSSGSSTKSR